MRADPAGAMSRRIAASLCAVIVPLLYRCVARRCGRRPTVSASVLGSFGFRHGAFTPPARPLLTRAAATERLAGAPSGAAPHRRVEGL
eukprot:4765648-Prymnesium_polylepis.1